MFMMMMMMIHEMTVTQFSLQ